MKDIYCDKGRHFLRKLNDNANVLKLFGAKNVALSAIVFAFVCARHPVIN